MAFEMNDVEDYFGLQGPHKEDIESAIKSIYQEAQHFKSDDAKRGVTDALYLAVKKRMKKRPFEGDERAYLTGLMSDISEAKFEYSQVCYTNSRADQTFSALKATILGLMI